MLILASASPRRRELLKLITDDFLVLPSHADESANVSDPALLAQLLAVRKARDVFRVRPQDTVIGADTLVYKRGHILGKPKDRGDAARMMRMLSGSRHRVYTGLCVISPKSEVAAIFKTEVYFNEISPAELKEYLDKADYMDKAGAYAVQEHGARFVQRIDGDYFNVMGLPVCGLYNILKEFDVCT